MLRAWCAVLVVVATLSGCSWLESDSPEEQAATAFLAAVAKGDDARAAALTDAPDAADEGLGQARAALRAESVKAALTEVDGTTATYTLSWRLSHDRAWRYEAHADLVEGQHGWRVRWAPSVLHPRLGAEQTLGMQEDYPDIAPVLDRAGQPLLAPGFVVSIMLYQQEAAAGAGLGSVAASLASALRRFDDSISSRSILAGVRKLPKKTAPYLVAVLRRADYLRVKPQIYDLPGVRFAEQERLLAPEKSFGLQVLPAIRSLVEKQVVGVPGWRVIARDVSGHEAAELYAQPPKPGRAAHSVLSRVDQAAAEDAVNAESRPTALVAMTASTGELLAVAQNEKADEQGAIALTGRYPPGSTFKIATALAAMTAGKVTPRSEVDCPGTTVIGHRLVPNEDRFELGRVPLSTAFARSCNTTFARLAAGLPADALTNAARDLGIGADFEIRGLTTITGSVPPAEDVVQRAENGFGQGKVLASPFGMALAAATVATGKTPVPSLMADTEVPATNLGSPLPAAEVRSLRQMMRKVVTSGTAQLLAGLPGVHGKTGTAQFGDGSRSHGWFVGYSGDRAFAVLVVGGDSSRPAVAVANRFLARFE